MSFSKPDVVTVFYECTAKRDLECSVYRHGQALGSRDLPGLLVRECYTTRGVDEAGEFEGYLFHEELLSLIAENRHKMGPQGLNLRVAVDVYHDARWCGRAMVPMQALVAAAYELAD